MFLDDDACYRVFCVRDGRFDGRIFVGVHTTGIYCRPICPAPPPKRANVSFFDTAVAAQQAGFRPCLRCRPEVSPRFAAWNGSSSLVSRALRLIDDGALDNVEMETFAGRMGVGARQLRRLFAEYMGAPPIAFAQMRRVHLAKQLLQETRIPVTEVGLAAGFSSVRRFNEAFLAAFGRAPSQFRRVPGEEPGRIALRLGVAPPFDWTGLLDTLERRAIAGVETVSEGRYRRTFQEGGSIGTIGVKRLDERTLKVEVCFPDLSALPGVLARVRILFDLGADPAALSERFGHDPVFGKQLAANPGLRVAGPWEPFEHVVRTIVDQQVDRVARSDRLATFAGRYGKRLDNKEGEPAVVFPEPARIVERATADLMPEASASLAINSYARAVAEGRQPLTLYDTLEVAVEKLQALPGFDLTLAEQCATGFLHPTDAIGGADVCDVSRYDHWRPWRAYAASLDHESRKHFDHAA